METLSAAALGSGSPARQYGRSKSVPALLIGKVVTAAADTTPGKALSRSSNCR
jgi:hypothetical protein